MVAAGPMGGGGGLKCFTALCIAGKNLYRFFSRRPGKGLDAAILPNALLPVQSRLPKPTPVSFTWNKALVAA